MAAYKIISCDDHLDLNALPADLWTSRLAAEFQDRAPHIEERDGKAVWVCDGQVWGSWYGRLGDKSFPRPVANILNAFQRAGMEDVGERRPAVAELRLADMDRDGVYAHVIYGPVTSIFAEDPPLRDACYAAYNDWLADFCAVAPDRLLGVRMLPAEPASATAELLRLAKKGRVRQVNVQLATVKTPLTDRAWEPFWQALEDTGTLLSFHVVVGRATGQFKPGSSGATLAQTKGFPEQFLDGFVDLLAGAVLERHPKVKLLLAECGAGWLPWIVQDLDHRFDQISEVPEYWERHGGIALKQRPSEVFKRQVYVTFQDDEVAVSLLKFYGPDNVLWASDYPHPDSTWPRSQEAIERQMGALPDAVKKKLLHDNAAKLYGLNA